MIIFMTVFIINALLVGFFFFCLFGFFSLSQTKSKSNTVILIAHEKGSIYKRCFSPWVVGFFLFCFSFVFVLSLHCWLTNISSPQFTFQFVTGLWSNSFSSTHPIASWHDTATRCQILSKPWSDSFDIKVIAL